MADQQFTPTECRENAQLMRDLANEQPWAAISHRQVAGDWDELAKISETQPK